MKFYVRGFALLAIAVACGLVGLALPDGVLAGIANLFAVGVGLAGVVALVGAIRAPSKDAARD